MASLKLTVNPENSYHPQDFFLLRTKSVRRQRLKFLALPSLSLPSPQLLSMQFGSNLVHYNQYNRWALQNKTEWNTQKVQKKTRASHIRISFEFHLSSQFLYSSYEYQIATTLHCKPVDAYRWFWTLQLGGHRILKTNKLPPPGLTGIQSDTGKYLSLRNESNTTYNLLPIVSLI